MATVNDESEGQFQEGVPAPGQQSTVPPWIGQPIAPRDRGESADAASLGERVYQVLVDRIIEGRIGYGEKLSLRRLARALNVSTMPVREAVRRLAMEDVVTIKPRSNCYIKLPTRASMQEAFEMREMLESYSVEKIFSTVTLEELSGLRRYLDEMDRTLPTGNRDSRMREYVRWDQLFHQELCMLAGNSYLLRMYRMNMLHLNIALTFRAGAEPDMDQVNEDHRSIFRHLANNSREAVDALRRHLHQCKRNMVQGELFRSLP
jgi:DNA-binding GntR family transcriptional regulator